MRYWCRDIWSKSNKNSQSVVRIALVWMLALGLAHEPAGADKFKLCLF